MSYLKEETIQAYRSLLCEKSIPLKSHSYYLRWVRLFIDYCGSCGNGPQDPDLLSQWMQELSKNRLSTFLQTQARDAVTLYLGVPYENDKYKDNTEGPPEKTLEPGLSWEKSLRRLEQEIRLRHYSVQTLKNYHNWLRQFQRFSSCQPDDLETQEVKAFLTYLAVERQVSASSQNQAFNALLFYYRHVLQREFGKVQGVVRAKRRNTIPVVLSRAEIDHLLLHLDPPYNLLIKLLYGCGLRISEGLSLRIQDLNFEMEQIHVFRGKGNKDRNLPMPHSVRPDLFKHIEHLKLLHQADLAAGFDGVFLSDRNGLKFKQAAKEFAWQWLFPAKKLTPIPETGQSLRYHLHDTHVSRAIRKAAIKAQLSKRITAHTFRHSYATHLLQANFDIQTIQHLLGHSDIRTTMIYLHTSPSKPAKELKSPLDLAQ